MCQVVAIAAVIISVYIPALAQGMLPPADGALILAVKSSRQASAIAPYELKLLSGTQITVSAVDVDGPATELVRSAMAKQSRQVVKPSHLFVLRIQRAAEVGKSRTEVVLLSGATVQVATPDVRDPRLTFLRTELAQAAALQRHVPIPEGPELSVEERYVRTVHFHMMLKWQEPEGAAGVVTLRVVVKRDGRMTDIAVEKSGGETLDAAVIRGIRAVGQLPPFPAGLLKDELTFRITLRGPSILPRSWSVNSPTTPDRFNAIDRTNGLGLDIADTTVKSPTTRLAFTGLRRVRDDPSPAG